jgi:hypothetical protein
MPASPRQTGLIGAEYSTLRGEWKCYEGLKLAGKFIPWPYAIRPIR